LFVVPKNILLAGLYHETHTFLPTTTGLDAFPLVKGAEILDMRGDGSPIDGFLEAAEDFNWEVTPLVDARAMPSGMVEDQVVEAYWEAFEEGLKKTDPSCVDAFMLILHGAMVSPSYPDVEGELLRRIQEVPEFGSLPRFAVLDLHANVSPEMAERANGLIAYEKNPHTDARDTAIRAAHLLNLAFESKSEIQTFHREAGILLPPLSSGTHADPMKALNDLAQSLMASFPEFLDINVMAGFPYADTPHAGVSFSVVSRGDAAGAESALHQLVDKALELRSYANIQQPDAKSVFPGLAGSSEGLTVIVESSDNIGAGTSGDATGALRGLLQYGLSPAAVVINDPEAVAKIRDKTIGDEVDLEIGGRNNPFDEGPVPIRAILKNRTNGRFDLEDRQSHLASMGGIHIDMGPSAVLQTNGIEILLTTKPTPPFDLGQLRSQGIIPENKAFIVVKAAVGHKQAYDPITKHTVFVETPGPCPTDLSRLPFQKLKRPIFPLDPFSQP
jgi:microcystin degradation protein MlrC